MHAMSVKAQTGLDMTNDTSIATTSQRLSMVHLLTMIENLVALMIASAIVTGPPSVGLDNKNDCGYFLHGDFQ